MKRHDALIPLSRDHHEALILSRLIQANAPVYKGLPEDHPGKAVYAAQFFKDHLVEHFREEESVFVLAKGTSDEMDGILNELTGEHDRLTKLFNSIPTSSNLEGDLDILGKFLESHIRKEERILFPMMQEQLSDKTLDSIATLTNRV